MTTPSDGSWSAVRRGLRTVAKPERPHGHDGQQTLLTPLALCTHHDGRGEKTMRRDTASDTSTVNNDIESVKGSRRVRSATPNRGRHRRAARLGWLTTAANIIRGLFASDGSSVPALSSSSSTSAAREDPIVDAMSLRPSTPQTHSHEHSPQSHPGSATSPRLQVEDIQMTRKAVTLRRVRADDASSLPRCASRASTSTEPRVDPLVAQHTQSENPPSPSTLNRGVYVGKVNDIYTVSLDRNREDWFYIVFKLKKGGDIHVRYEVSAGVSVCLEIVARLKFLVNIRRQQSL